MEISFYLAAIVAVFATFRVVTHTNPVHALLYLVVSLLAVAMAFFALGAPFAAALEIIVYAGAIMVLFVFVMMMLNLGSAAVDRERQWLQSSLWIGPSIMATVLILVFAYAFIDGGGIGTVSGETLMAKEVGIALFGPYLLIVELASFLLLAALVAAAHIGRDDSRREQPLRNLNGSVRQPSKLEQGGER
ncbi:NADH-quinone oxidoreductase subunit J [Phytohalomonas tamaricis]|uniref:NADH-quinone oxidoreductase subunit J n=1 Tax=Phytohalomonas tamaricis TaxID=2081032 RepID=UPI000D0B9322|nr:NADH-quinone oxidoreductase subunit J [Phytohalomonas tamaricis]